MGIANPVGLLSLNSFCKSLNMNKELKGRLHCSLRFIFLDKIMQRIVYYFITNEVFLNFINHFSRTFSLTLLHSFFPYTRGFSAGRDGQRLPGLSAERSFQSLPWKAMLRQVEHFIIQSQWSTVFSTQFIYSCAIPIVARFFSGLYFFFFQLHWEHWQPEKGSVKKQSIQEQQ